MKTQSSMDISTGASDFIWLTASNIIQPPASAFLLSEFPVPTRGNLVCIDQITNLDLSGDNSESTSLMICLHLECFKQITELRNVCFSYPRVHSLRRLERRLNKQNWAERYQHPDGRIKESNKHFNSALPFLVGISLKVQVKCYNSKSKNKSTNSAKWRFIFFTHNNSNVSTPNLVGGPATLNTWLSTLDPSQFIFMPLFPSW